MNQPTRASSCSTCGGRISVPDPGDWVRMDSWATWQVKDGRIWCPECSPVTQEQAGTNKTAYIRELCKKEGMRLETITASTCPYGDFNAHMNGSANCELDDCVYSGKPVKP